MVEPISKWFKVIGNKLIFTEANRVVDTEARKQLFMVCNHFCLDPFFEMCKLCTKTL